MTRAFTAQLDPSGAVELAVVTRSGLRESSHSGAAVVLDPSGVPLVTHGNSTALIYPRSTIKLMQAVTVLRSGVSLEGEQLVLATASHTGTPQHVAVVRAILERAGLTEGALQCPVDWPGDMDARQAADGPARVYMNCSGKHAAFLLACVQNGWSIEDYLDPEHPLQRAIRITVEEYTGEPIVHTGVDGCGAPVHALSLRGLARATGLIARGVDEHAATLAHAIRQSPWALDNPSVATFVRETGLLAKSGAEGVFVAATEDGTAVALKMLDGSGRASIEVALSLLGGLGLITAETRARVSAAATDRVLGGGVPVGEIIATV